MKRKLPAIALAFAMVFAMVPSFGLTQTAEAAEVPTSSNVNVLVTQDYNYPQIGTIHKIVIDDGDSKIIDNEELHGEDADYTAVWYYMNPDNIKFTLDYDQVEKDLNEGKATKITFGTLSNSRYSGGNLTASIANSDIQTSWHNVGASWERHPADYDGADAATVFMHNVKIEDDTIDLTGETPDKTIQLSGIFSTYWRMDDNLNQFTWDITPRFSVIDCNKVSDSAFVSGTKKICMNDSLGIELPVQKDYSVSGKYCNTKYTFLGYTTENKHKTALENGDIPIGCLYYSEEDISLYPVYAESYSYPVYVLAGRSEEPVYDKTGKEISFPDREEGKSYTIPETKAAPLTETDPETGKTLPYEFLGWSKEADSRGAAQVQYKPGKTYNDMPDSAVTLYPVYEKVSGESHVWNEDYAVDKEPTCTEEGEKSIYCKKCGAKKDGSTVKIPELGHSYTDSITEPTCTKDGYTIHRCSRCGDRYTDSETKAKGHTFGEWTTIAPSTCTDDGMKQRVCSLCGYTETEGIDADGHTWNSEYTIDQAASCTKDGSRSIHCQKCDARKDAAVIPATGHSYRLEIVTRPTCAKTGTANQICNICGAKEAVVIAAIGHNWNSDYTVDQAASCAKDGSKSIHCKSCHIIKDGSSLIIEATGHQYVSKTIAAKIGVAGKTYEECSICGDITNEKAIKALRPYSTTIQKLTRSKKAFTVKWKKKAYTGYQIRYSRYSSMKSAKTVTITKNSTTSKKVRHLKSKKKYYVQVRTYKKVNGTKCYSSWSKKKSVRTR